LCADRERFCAPRRALQASEGYLERTSGLPDLRLCRVQIKTGRRESASDGIFFSKAGCQLAFLPNCPHSRWQSAQEGEVRPYPILPAQPGGASIARARLGRITEARERFYAH